MLIIEIVSKKPLSPAQAQVAALKKKSETMKRQKADVDVMRKREQLLKAQQKQLAVGKGAW